MPVVTTAEGNSIHYEHFLPEGAARTPVVFSCAYCTTRENWRGQVEPLRAAGHPVVLWDLRGHGDSPAPEDGKQPSDPGENAPSMSSRE